MSDEPKDASWSETTPPPPGAAGSGGLQFDTATYTQPVAFKTCSGCQQGIANTYFELGGKTICPRCRDRVTGGAAGRWDFWRALLFGGLAGAAGTLVWSLIIHLTGYELGIIAIFLGVGIGMAVRKGSRGRGGWKYQTLAMILTYVSITTSYVPMVWKGMVQGLKQKPHAAEMASTATTESEKASLDRPVADNGATRPPSRGALGTMAAVLVALGLLWGIALAAPFLGGLSNILGLIIIGVGLYEAWKLNRRVPFSGPFQMVAATPPLPTQPGTP